MLKILQRRTLDTIDVDKKIAKALKPLKKMINDLKSANDNIDLCIEDNEQDIDCLRNLIDGLSQTNMKLDVTRDKNSETIQNLLNLTGGM